MGHKILFADFDGPLWSDRVIRYHPDNTNATHPKREIIAEAMRQNGDTMAAHCLTYWKMDEVAVGMLNWLMEYDHFYTVVSSTWRELCTRDTIECIFRMNDLRLELHDDWATDAHTSKYVGGWYGTSSSSDNRLKQIARWVDKNKEIVDDYLILDDPSSGGSLIDENAVRWAKLDPSRVVIVDPFIGMEISHFEQMKRVFCE